MHLKISSAKWWPFYFYFLFYLLFLSRGWWVNSLCPREAKWHHGFQLAFFGSDNDLFPKPLPSQLSPITSEMHWDIHCDKWKFYLKYRFETEIYNWIFCPHDGFPAFLTAMTDYSKWNLHHIFKCIFLKEFFYFDSYFTPLLLLTHWGRVTHIFASGK